MNKLDLQRQFKFSRYFSITSFLSILAAAAVLAFLFKQVTLYNISQTIEQSNIQLVQTLFNSVKVELADYLKHVAVTKKSNTEKYPIPEKLQSAIKNIMTGTSLIKIKIIDQQGTVVYSTNQGQIGDIQHYDYTGESILSSEVVSTFHHNHESKVTDIISSHLPIHLGETEMKIGAFDLHTDVTIPVQIANTAQLITTIGIVLIFTLLYTLLLLIVRRSERVIIKQQSTIQERNTLLELFSTQLLTAEDKREERIAFGLHEGIAQNLAAIKMNIEQFAHDNKSDKNISQSVKSIVPMIQTAIQDTRDLAMDLRPSTLNDFGLAPTIKWACEKATTPESILKIATKIDIDENQIPSNLKVVIYRILIDSLENVFDCFPVVSQVGRKSAFVTH